jgi:hypothetical protein
MLVRFCGVKSETTPSAMTEMYTLYGQA